MCYPMAKSSLTIIELRALQTFANEERRFWKMKLKSVAERGSLKGVLGELAKRKDFQQVVLQTVIRPGFKRFLSILPPVALYYGPVVSCPVGAEINF